MDKSRQTFGRPPLFAGRLVGTERTLKTKDNKNELIPTGQHKPRLVAFQLQRHADSANGLTSSFWPEKHVAAVTPLVFFFFLFTFSLVDFLLYEFFGAPLVLFSN